MTSLMFGTAHLYGLVGAADSDRLLAAAYDAGVRRFDTSPSYGGGHTEARVADFAAGRPGVELVSTKTGMVAPAGPMRARKVAKRVAHLLPRRVTSRLRARSHEAALGHFDPAEVRSSVDRSLARLGRVDRLLLHEVRPSEITADLLEALETYRRNGDIGQIGVATRNEHTLPCLVLAPEVFSVAQVAVGPMDTGLDLPAYVTARVGHGVFGASGDQLRAMTTALRDDGPLNERWSAATAGTEYDGPDGLGDALLVRAGGGLSDDIIVATSRVERLERALRLVTQSAPLPVAVAAGLIEVAGAAASRSHGGLTVEAAATPS